MGRSGRGLSAIGAHYPYAPVRRRQKIEALIMQVEMEKEQYGTEGLWDLLPPISWHERVMEALAA
jgi:hypothetical protein